MTNTDVDIDTMLGIEPESEAPAADGASAETADKEPVVSQRAQERIRELVEENKRLKQPKTPQTAEEQDLERFIGSIQDEPSRDLLRKFGQLILKEADKKLSPVMSDYQGNKFEREFGELSQKLPDIAAFKDDIKQTIAKNPDADLKQVVGAKLIEVQMSKVTPVESASTAPRSEAPDLNSASTDELYSILESMKK